jgi:hypothetical protein
MQASTDLPTECTCADSQWTWIDGVQNMSPFLVSLISDDNHWMFISSNGGMTAGRRNADHAIFPYYTQDKLEQLSGQCGGFTLIAVEASDGSTSYWQPFSRAPGASLTVERRVGKNALGNHFILQETHPALGLCMCIHWRPSSLFGFVRNVQICSLKEQSVKIRVLDGFLDLLPPGIEQRFQNEFSILGNAYKQAELQPKSHLGTFHLSSVPTDLAHPMEGLRATVAWQIPPAEATFTLSEAAIESFLKGDAITSITHNRGRRNALLMVMEGDLEAKGCHEWMGAVDLDLDAPAVEALHNRLANDPANLRKAAEADCDATESQLTRMLSANDGFQTTAAPRRTLRHTSNTIFNLMRGGFFPLGYELPKEDLLSKVAHFNAGATDQVRKLIEESSHLDCADPWKMDPAAGNRDLIRLLREYLPLSFSRRHGDPSRPWNRFSIDIAEKDGSPRFAYQGNWRDIFQNWEALTFSWPLFTGAVINRFLNASTADGYNPYRITESGYDWETIEPNDPWANIGYWGDHQLVYLLRLLESAKDFFPGFLKQRLADELYVYAEIPYRIRDYESMLANPRETIDYDEAWESRIHERVNSIGADGQLMPAPEGGILYVSLLEKLLNPLIAKASNFVPGGGIWMNTQRPEWNDANNALVGFGISVVTLGYMTRYVAFMNQLLEDDSLPDEFALSEELLTLLQAQTAVFTQAPVSKDPAGRAAFMRQLGQSASEYRETYYTKGLSGNKATISRGELNQWLSSMQAHLAQTLLQNERPDGLWHSYNLLELSDGGIGVRNLYVMLEGQVSALSSGLLSPAKAIHLLEGLRKSPLYREDQDSYILYPNRDLPGYLEKNHIPQSAFEGNQALLEKVLSGSPAVLSKRLDGSLSFDADLHNAMELKALLDSLDDYSTEETRFLTGLFEDIFNHHAFTGRSGTFFAYEGLGSIYWHMVSKLLLSVQEVVLDADEPLPESEKVSLREHYTALLKGIGAEKTPQQYGAFPTDAYSHTPAHTGAQQPGMTGQVKEDFLSRMAELGITITEGSIHFKLDLLNRAEFLAEPQTISHIGVDGKSVDLALPAGSLAFSYCQVPIIYHSGQAKDGISLTLDSGDEWQSDALSIPPELAETIFIRSGKVRRIEVSLAS